MKHDTFQNFRFFSFDKFYNKRFKKSFTISKIRLSLDVFFNENIDKIMKYENVCEDIAYLFSNLSHQEKNLKFGKYHVSLN